MVFKPEDQQEKNAVECPSQLAAIEAAEAAAREARVELIAVSLSALSELKELDLGNGADDEQFELHGRIEWPRDFPRG